jgi:hypothetical protein
MSEKGKKVPGEKLPALIPNPDRFRVNTTSSLNKSRQPGKIKTQAVSTNSNRELPQGSYAARLKELWGCASLA